jgi:hypothetical protein
MINRICILLLLLVCSRCLAQEAELDKYLRAAKTPELDASRKTMMNYSFGPTPDFKLSGYFIVDTLRFVTDKPPITGFRVKLSCNVADSTNTKDQTAILYFDKRNRHWSVFSFSDISDAETRYQRLKADVAANTYYKEKEYVLRELSQLAIMSGHLADGRKYIMLAYATAKAHGKTNFSTAYISEFLKRIM